jgi:pyruvate dehydrogenase E1 component
MFGFQRVGDLIWALGDARGRGFLCGATSGRTTLMGEGLQHQDGHALLVASTVPPCQAYDPAFAYELGTIVEDGLRRMYVDGEDVFYYLTLYNENYAMAAAPADLDRAGILKGLYRHAEAPDAPSTRATVIFSGPSHLAAQEAANELAGHFDVGVELWSATSYKALRDEANSVERWNQLHPEEPARIPYVTAALSESSGPIVAVSDFMRAVPDQVSRWSPRRWCSLGTDGYGRSDTREALRRHFEIDAGHIIVAVLGQLASEGVLDKALVADAIERYDIDIDLADPWSTQAH